MARMSMERRGPGEGPEPPGLTGEAEADWPKAPEPGTPPGKVLVPGSDAHTKVLDYLIQRLTASERKMAQFYPRWEVAEKKVQAYVNLRDYELLLKQLNDKTARPPQVISVVVPYTYAVVATTVTYLLHTFCGRKPMFQVGAYKDESMEATQKMEQVLQYQADHARMIKQFYRWFNDGEVYGVGILRTQWVNKKAKRTTWKSVDQRTMTGMAMGQKKLIPSRAPRVVYSGNMVDAIDPFMFFPDPRCPMTEVNRRGEFVFWRCYSGKHEAKKLELDGVYSYVDACTAPMPKNEGWDGDSARSIRAEGDANPGMNQLDGQVRDFYQVDEGTVEIVPAELGLGDSKRPEKWLFTILNKSTIVRAEPFDADHDMHPVSVIEPYETGYGFGNLGLVDYTSPLQDLMSFLVNSHMANVRTAINNMLVVDPSMVEMQDLRGDGDNSGRIIRLKRAAFGQDVRTAITQLAVTDVTAGHMRDLQSLLQFGAFLTAISENLMGVQDQGGRKTATEVRTSGEAAGSRLAAHARVISCQGVVDLTEQMAVNTQQYLDEGFYIELVGEEGKRVPLKVDPSQLNGDFHYPVNDGTLPIDRTALLDVWKEIMMVVGRDQELRQQYSMSEIFEWVAELGGARNIQSFRISVAPPGAGMPPGAVPLSPGMGLPGMDGAGGTGAGAPPSVGGGSPGMPPVPGGVPPGAPPGARLTASPMGM